MFDFTDMNFLFAIDLYDSFVYELCIDNFDFFFLRFAIKGRNFVLFKGQEFHGRVSRDGQVKVKHGACRSHRTGFEEDEADVLGAFFHVYILRNLKLFKPG